MFSLLSKRAGRSGRRPALLALAATIGLCSSLAVPSVAASATPRPPTPTNLVVRPGVGGLGISWTAVSATPGSTVTYKVASSPAGKSCRTTSTSCIVLVSDTVARSFTVRATIGSASSEPSAASSPVPTRVVLVVAGQSNAQGMDVPTYPVDYFSAPYANAADGVDQMMWLTATNPQLTLTSIDSPQLVNGPWQGMGPEIGIARQLMDDRGEEVAIVKDAVPGAFLATSGIPGWAYWSPTTAGSEYPKLIDGVRSALSQLADQGVLGVVGGLYWYQGESDAVMPSLAKSYKADLVAFIKALRRDLPGASHLPIILAKEDLSVDLAAEVAAGTMSPALAAADLRGNALVRAADDAIAATKPNVIAVDTADLARLDWNPIHLTAGSELALGRRLAVASEHLVP